MPPKKISFLSGPNKDKSGRINPEKVKTAKMDTQMKEAPFDPQKVKTASKETQKKEDPFDEEFDKFICSIEKEINELEEKHRNK